MAFGWSPPVAIMLLSGLVSGLSALYLWRRAGAVGRTGLAAVLAAAAAWSLAYGMELAAMTPRGRESWGAAKYVGVCVLPTAWLVFALQYTGRERWISRRLVGLTLVLPLIVLGLLAAPGTREMVRSYPPGPLKPFPTVALGPVFWVFFAYSAAVAAVGTCLLVLTLLRISSAYRRQSWVLVSAITLVWAANIATNVGVSAFRRVDPTPIALAVAGVVLIWGVFRFGLLDLVPVARTTLVETMKDAVLVLDAHHRVVDLNPAARLALGRPAPEVLGRRVEELLGQELPARTTHLRQELSLTTGRDAHDFEVVLSALEDRGAPAGHLLVLRDVTDRKVAERRLDHLAHHDLVTGLPNRTLFFDRLTQAVARAGRCGSQLAVLFLDLDRFKLINDSLGHDVGDRLLLAVTDRLQQCLRGEDTLARFGGDEFSVLLPDMAQPDEAAAVAARMLSSLSRPFPLNGRELTVTASVGLAVCPRDDTDGRRLVARAGEAMHVAKARGRNRVECANPRSGLDPGLILGLEADLRQAVQRRELFLGYQPLVSLGSGRLVGVEALVRWSHPRRGVLAPTEFLPLAEEAGLINGIDDWVMGEACRDVQSPELAVPADAFVAVNLSPTRQVDADLRGRLTGTLAATGLPPSRLLLELNERAVTGEGGSFAADLEALKTTGVLLALDDFGAGRTSLGQLRTLPLDVLKIDRSFISRLRVDADADAVSEGDVTIVAAIVGLAHALGLTVVAEGIERWDQLQVLRRLDCDIGQGFLFSPAGPLPRVLARHALSTGIARPTVIGQRAPAPG